MVGIKSRQKQKDECIDEIERCIEKGIDRRALSRLNLETLIRLRRLPMRNTPEKIINELLKIYQEIKEVINEMQFKYQTYKETEATDNYEK